MESPMESAAFERLLVDIQQQESGNPAKKIKILFESNGNFTALQCSSVLYLFKCHTDKRTALQIIAKRLLPMSCSECRDVLSAMSVHDDKIFALRALLPLLSDLETSAAGVHVLLQCFTFEEHKFRVLQMLRSLRPEVVEQQMRPAGLRRNGGGDDGRPSGGDDRASGDDVRANAIDRNQYTSEYRCKYTEDAVSGDYSGRIPEKLLRGMSASASATRVQ